MDMITIDGKDYLKTYIAKIDNQTIDASGLFIDVREAIEKILQKYNYKHKTSYSYIDRNNYGSNLQSILNRFSGNYFSPSFLKNYETNPALCLAQMFFEEKVHDATFIGTTFHTILEKYYQLPKEERHRDKIWEIADLEVDPNMDRTKLDDYLKGFIKSGDYLGGKLDDTTLNCLTEHRGRLKIHIKKFNYTLPCYTAYVADRIDLREKGNFIIDYKTGKPRESAVTFDGYLGSMLIYKWAVEQELDLKIDGAYLLAPGNKNKFMELDFSEENEKQMIENIERFYKQFTKDNQRRVYEFTNKGYFTSDDAKAFKNTMNDNTIWMAKLPIKIYIGEHADSVL